MNKLLQWLASLFGRSRPTVANPQPNISSNDEWYVEFDGVAVAVLSNPRCADMFWYTWDIRPAAGNVIPLELWDYESDARRGFRHCTQPYFDSCAFPAADNPIDANGRVLIRGPVCRIGKRPFTDTP